MTSCVDLNIVGTVLVRHITLAHCQLFEPRKVLCIILGLCSLLDSVRMGMLV